MEGPRSGSVQKMEKLRIRILTAKNLWILRIRNTVYSDIDVSGPPGIASDSNQCGSKNKPSKVFLI